jgi:hypothetical protein
MPSLAITCFGSVERVLGLAAGVFGEAELAVEHLERAVTANRLLDNRPVTAIALADLAEALLARRGPDDAAHAVRLLTRARAEAEAMDLPVRVTAWTRRLEELAEQAATIRRQGRHWTLTLGQRQAIVGDRVGVRHLVQLLTHPGEPVPVLALAGADAGRELAAPAQQPVLDQAARAAYRRRVSQLGDELAGASGARASALRAELDALMDELRRSTGKGGRSRHFADPAERARTAVRKGIKRAIDEIAAADPDLGALLRTTVTTGATCCYTPAPERPVRWTYLPSGRS